MRISAREACVKPHLRTRSDIKIIKCCKCTTLWLAHLTRQKHKFAGVRKFARNSFSFQVDLWFSQNPRSRPRVNSATVNLPARCLSQGDEVAWSEWRRWRRLLWWNSPIYLLPSVFFIFLFYLSSPSPLSLLLIRRQGLTSHSRCFATATKYLKLFTPLALKASRTDEWIAKQAERFDENVNEARELRTPLARILA